MKKLLLLLLIIPVFGHSQKPNQSSFPNYFDGFSQNLDIDMKQINQEFDNREIITDNESTDSYRLDEQTFVYYDIDGVINKTTLQFNENGKVIFYTKSIFTSTSVVGTWKLAREAGAIGVGPDKGDLSWWSSSSADLTRMDCLFDDEYVFNEDGTFENILGLETWLEPWQGLDEEGCGAAVYPHDGGTNYNYTYDMQAKTLKLNGKGAHIGLAKVYNLGELSSPSDAVDEITYIAELSSDGKSLQLSIERELMGGFWTFKLVRDNVSGSSLVPSFKNESSFDSNGNQTLQIRYYWDSESQSFVPGNKYEYNYDENGNQTLYLSYGWSSESQSFVPSGKIEYYYDENGNQTLYLSYGWSSESQSFVPSGKNEYYYDENGNRTHVINYGWSSESQSFVPSGKNEYTYDENGNLKFFFQYYWYSEFQSFVTSHKWEYNYDENGNLTLLISQFWSSESQSFVPDWKNEYTYDENGNQTLYERYHWGKESQSFYMSENIEYIFDENGNLVLRISKGGGNEVNQFSYGSKDEYTYNNDKFVITHIRHGWSSESQSFVPISKIKSSFDSNKLISTETKFKWYSGLGIFKPSFKMEFLTILETDTNLNRKGILFEYDTNFNTWNELVGDKYKSYFYYTKVSSLSTNSVETNSLLIYPNPTSSIINIEQDFTSAKVYDISGRELLKSKSKTIDLSELPSSIYLLRLYDNSNKVLGTSKVVKQ